MFPKNQGKGLERVGVLGLLADVQVWRKVKTPGFEFS